jgi:hypothetical protein
MLTKSYADETGLTRHMHFPICVENSTFVNLPSHRVFGLTRALERRQCEIKRAFRPTTWSCVAARGSTRVAVHP